VGVRLPAAAAPIAPLSISRVLPANAARNNREAASTFSGALQLDRIADLGVVDAQPIGEQRLSREILERRGWTSPPLNAIANGLERLPERRRPRALLRER